MHKYAQLKPSCYNYESFLRYNQSVLKKKENKRRMNRASGSADLQVPANSASGSIELKYFSFPSCIGFLISYKLYALQNKKPPNMYILSEYI